jgi:cobalamin biosynthesis Co2+ chelatase CbiK
MSAGSQNFQIVLAAFGTSVGSSAIYAILKERFEERFTQKVVMGFTSRVGNPKLKNVLEEIVPAKDLEVVIVPLFMIPGKVVLEDIKKVAEECTHHFRSVRVARPLLPDDRIYEVMRGELLPDLKELEPGNTGILFVGHGTPNEESSLIYMDVAQKVRSLFPPSVKVSFGNIDDSAPYCRDILGELVMSGIKTLLIQPFMIVDGVHIHDDIRGALDGDHNENKLYRHLLENYGDSFKERLREIECVYKPGLGAYRGVFEIFADHTLRAFSAGDFL